MIERQIGNTPTPVKRLHRWNDSISTSIISDTFHTINTKRKFGFMYLPLVVVDKAEFSFCIYRSAQYTTSRFATELQAIYRSEDRRQSPLPPLIWSCSRHHQLLTSLAIAFNPTSFHPPSKFRFSIAIRWTLGHKDL